MRVFVFEAVVVAVGGGAFVVVVLARGGDPSDSIFVRVNKTLAARGLEDDIR